MSEHGINLLIEPINPIDMPGYFLNDIQQAEEIINSVGLPNVKLQFDFYHIERIHGQALSFFKSMLSWFHMYRLQTLRADMSRGRGK